MNPQKAYKKFVDDRDRALEKIFMNYRLRINNIIRQAFGEIAFAFQHGHAPSDTTLIKASIDCQHLIQDMRKRVFFLAGASEAEILGRIFQKPTRFNPENYNEQIDMARGGSLAERLFYALRKIIRKLQDFQDRAALEKRQLSREEILSAFPKKKVLADTKILKKVREIKESDKNKDPFDMSTSQITDDEWDDIVYDYKAAYDIDARGPEEVLGYRTRQGDRQAVYGWEVEQDVTNDFVIATRAGQTDAAKQNGIQDFVWIAVIDNRTCDCTGCCLPRDGLTTSEIARLLKTKWRSAEIRVTVPPAHFNCRCTLAPVTKDLPDVPNSLIGDFNDWLES